MRKFNFALAPLVAFLGLTAATPTFAADDASFITSYSRFAGYRTFSITFDRDVYAAQVHVTGVIDGKCIKPHALVYMMGYDEGYAKEHKSGVSLGGSAGKNGASINATYNNQTTITQNIPARFVFSRNFGGKLYHVKYNIVFVRNGETRSTGWLPYNPKDDGGCIYDIGIPVSKKMRKQ